MSEAEVSSTMSGQRDMWHHRKLEEMSKFDKW